MRKLALILTILPSVALAQPAIERPFPLMYNRPNTLVYPNASLDGNFATGFCWAAQVGQQPCSSIFISTRSTVGWAQWADGHWSSFPALNLRNTDQGILIEPSGTNNALYARDMTQSAWILSNATTTLTATGIDNVANDATTLTATANNATATQTVTLTSAAHVYSVWLQRVTGTGNVSISLDGSSWTTETVTATWTRFYISTTSANPTIGIQLATSGDVVNVDVNQLETASYPSSPMISGSSIATRSSEHVSSRYYQPSQIGFVAMSAILTIGAANSTGILIWTTDNPVINDPFVSLSANTYFPAVTNNGSTLLNGFSSFVVGTAKYITAAWDSTRTYAAQSGSANYSSKASTFGSTGAQLNVGANFSGGSACWCYVKHIAAGYSVPTQAQMQKGL